MSFEKNLWEGDFFEMQLRIAFHVVLVLFLLYLICFVNNSFSAKRISAVLFYLFLAEALVVRPSQWIFGSFELTLPVISCCHKIANLPGNIGIRSSTQTNSF